MMTPANIDNNQVVKEYISGKSELYLANLFGCSTSAISRRLRKLGVKPRPFSTKGLKPQLGKVLSKETKEKIRQRHIGKKIPKEIRMKMGSKGNKNSGYIDGRTPENKRIRHSVEYKLWREAVFQRDDYTCQLCGKRGGDINADHIKPFSQYPEFRTSIENGRTLCVKCHRKTETFGNGSKKV